MTTGNTAYDPKKYEDFIEKWKKESGYTHFCYDGPIDDNKWAESSSKIMFLLKESYNTFYDIRNNKCLSGAMVEGVASKRFFRKMRMWTYIIDETLENKSPSFVDAEKRQDCLNDSVAYVNLKKNVEDKTKSKYKDIKGYVLQDKELLLEQIDLINPRIIVCSGTFSFCRDYLYGNLNQIADRLYKMENRYFIDFWHLSYWWKSAKATCNKLRDIIGNIK